MSLRFSYVTSLVLAFAACGGDDGGSDNPVDGGNNPVDALPIDAYVPPTANCDPLDLANAPVVTVVSNQPITPNPQGGTVRPGIYELTSAKLYALGIAVTGTAQARVEIVVGNATSGAARVAVKIDGEAIGNQIMQELTGAGLYSITGTDLTVADGCGASEELPVLEYTATDTTMTLWTEYMITDPLTLNIPLELGVTLE
ncbi:MAG: hypothetical protein SFX73_14370 [Kofleriaceae bacterium]|nr:hypothetical protein [Kofleriaceae bacterium]